MALICRISAARCIIHYIKQQRSAFTVLGHRHTRAVLTLNEAERHCCNQKTKIVIGNKLSAELFIKDLSKAERKRLRNAIILHMGDKSKPHAEIISVSQMKQLFYANAIPLIGFGFLDNALMIIAGEYVDQTLGAILAISTMAAAGLGHIAADLAGMALTHYVEFLASKTGVRQPFLTPAQRDSSCARKLVNFGRATGLVVGCIIGMLPLLFYENPKIKCTPGKEMVAS